MPTTKQRINITVDKDTCWALKKLAKATQTSISTTALKLIKIGIEMQKDSFWGKIAERRKNKK